MTKNNLPAKVFLAAVWTFALLIILLPFLRQEGYLWDFYAYYGSVMAFRDGLNPYSLEWQNATYAAHGNGLRFVYPPLAIFYFFPLSWLPQSQSVIAFYVVKLLALGGLLWLWNKYFLKVSLLNAGTILFLLFAFNGTLVWDIYANNITIFEQVITWTALYFLLRGRLALFTLLILFVAQFKLTPIAYLLLLLFVPERPAWKTFFAGCLGFTGYIAVNFLIFPKFCHEFLFATQTRLIQYGIQSPSVQGFISDGLNLFNSVSLPVKINPSNWFYFFFAYALVIFGVLIALLLKQRPKLKNEKHETQIAMVMLFVLAHTLLHWRLGSYQYVQVLLPTLYFLRTRAERFQLPVVAFFLFWPYHLGGLHEVNSHSPLPGPIHKVAGLCYEYLPFVTALMIFVLWAYDEWAREKTKV